MTFRYLHGPITQEQHDVVTTLPDSYVRTRGYCWLTFWIPGHPLHDDACL